jgi:hypothetical protein
MGVANPCVEVPCKLIWGLVRRGPSTPPKTTFFATVEHPRHRLLLNARVLTPTPLPQELLGLQGREQEVSGVLRFAICGNHTDNACVLVAKLERAHHEDLVRHTLHE